MKIALCFSGMLRTWDKCFPTIIQHVIKANPEHQFDSFIATWDVRGKNPVWWQSTGDLDLVDINALYIPELNLKSVLVDTYQDSDFMKMVERETGNGGRFYPMSGMQCNPRNVMPMLKKIEQAHNLAAENGNNGVKYDLFVKLRTDLLFTGDMKFSEPQNLVVFMPDHECWGPGALNDQLVYGSPQVMTIHAMIFGHLERIFKETRTLHPETLLDFWYRHMSVRVVKETIPYRIER
jgi:hypothetical protein